jgi:hypothetical protein
LYGLTGQFHESVANLKVLLAQSPFDHAIHFRIAKDYLLMGEMELATQHSLKARLPDLSGIAAELFAIAMERVEASVESRRLKDSSILQIERYQPEDRGIVSCRLALSNIVESDFETAIEVLNNVNYADRLHEDFATVLRFHASKRLQSPVDYHSEQEIFRIAKRGYRPLRDSVAAIVDGNYDVAIEKERRLCLLVA